MKKHLMLFMFVAAVALAADDKSAKANTGPVSVSDAKPGAINGASETIPEGATKVSDNTWRKVDDKGQAWIYRKTPFGVMKAPEKKEAAVDPPSQATGNPFGGDTAAAKKAAPAAQKPAPQNKKEKH
jgi:hypothetical protein